ncbi:MAG: adenylosuccinate synthase [Clostridia bacterium]|nr:adenylosuccinate synthase [Clostridia bacterium]
MSTVVLVGTQWGDEGKGRFVDFLAEKAKLVVRFQGGDNAGHTVETGGKTYKLHLIPSGIFYKDKTNVIGSGVVINPAALIEEMDMLKAAGIDYSGLRISARAQVIMPWHMAFDKIFEERLGDSALGTTHKGIGPAYMDKAERIGIRICDLMDDKIMYEKISSVCSKKNDILVNFYKSEAFDEKQVIADYKAYADKIRPYVIDAADLIYSEIENGANVLFEGAQGTLLDLNMGTYPFVTSSHPIAGGVCIGTGIGPTCIDMVLGIAKAYTTRVGAGPFVTELNDKTGEAIREKGHEYGATTGRPRRCGWLDTVILKYSARVNGLTHLAVSRMDTLGGFDEVKICTGYKKDGKITDVFPVKWEDLDSYEPIYETLPGWSDDISHIRKFEELPENAQKYIKRIEELVKVPVVMLGVGAAREQAIVRKELF